MSRILGPQPAKPWVEEGSDETKGMAIGSLEEIKTAYEVLAQSNADEDVAGRRRCVGEVFPLLERIQCGNARALRAAKVAGRYG